MSPFRTFRNCGQLVEAGLAQEAADGRDARVVRQFVQGLALRRLAAAVPVGDEPLDVFAVDGRVVVHLHGAEFQEVEVAAVLPKALLAKEDGPFGCELDGNRNSRE